MNESFILFSFSIYCISIGAFYLIYTTAQNPDAGELLPSFPSVKPFIYTAVYW